MTYLGPQNPVISQSIDNLKDREQDGGGVDGRGYVSLDGYVRNTPSDAELHAEHQLRADRST